MQKIFVIGNIGSGKSTFCQFLGEAINGVGAASAVNASGANGEDGAQCAVINLDKLGHDALENSEVKAAIKAAFGPLRSRVEIARVAFSNANNLNKLNQIMHPYILKDLRIRLREAEDAGIAYVVVEQTAVKGKDDEFLQLADIVVCVNSSKIYSETPNRLAAQLSQAQLQSLADIVVENDSDLQGLKKKTQQVAEKIVYSTAQNPEEN